MAKKFKILSDVLIGKSQRTLIFEGRREICCSIILKSYCLYYFLDIGKMLLPGNWNSPTEFVHLRLFLFIHLRKKYLLSPDFTKSFHEVSKNISLDDFVKFGDSEWFYEGALGEDGDGMKQSRSKRHLAWQNLFFGCP